MDDLTYDTTTDSTDAPTVRRRLGRGLNALLGGGAPEAPSDPLAAPTADAAADADQVQIDLIDRNPFQPRSDFDPGSLNELVDSIRQHGVLQPVLVRPAGGRFQLIAGERRWLAAQQAGLQRVPCRVLQLEDQNVCEAALEENLKRKDLNPLEKAQAFQDYLNRFGTSIEAAAKRFSMQRSTVSNYLRLLELPDAIKKSLVAEKITNGHARALLSLEDDEARVALCKRIVAESLSVRKTEQAVRDAQRAVEEPAEPTIPFPADQPEPEEAPAPTNHVLSVEQQLRDQLGVRVDIKLSGKDAGRVVIRFDSGEEFDRIVRRLRHAEAA